MTGVATIVCLVLALGLAVVAGVRALREQASTRGDLIGAGVVEVAVLFYTVVRVIDLVDGHRTSGNVIVVAYLVGLVLTMPVAAALSYVEVSRWGSVVLGCGALIACVLFARINQLWTPHG